jgi:hypothetical protein
MADLAHQFAPRIAAAQERAKQDREWLKTIPKTDYAAICAAIKAHRRDRPDDGSVH